MLTNQNHPFKLVTEALALPSAKNRVSITKVLSEDNILYEIYVNDLGQIMLDPIGVVPDHQLWLFKNKKAMASLEKGLEESYQGKTRYLGSFAKKTKKLKSVKIKAKAKTKIDAQKVSVHK